MKKNKRKSYYRIIALVVAVVMVLPFFNRNKKIHINKLKDLYYQHFNKDKSIFVYNETEFECINEFDISDENTNIKNDYNNDDITNIEMVPITNNFETEDIIEKAEETIESDISYNEEETIELDISYNEEETIELDISYNEEATIIIDNEKITPIETYPSKQVAFTFDDGPSVHTEELLKILSENNASATFFVLGNRIEKYGNTIENIKSDGHQIESHGMNHEEFTKLSNDELKLLLETTKLLLAEYGVLQTLVRPPYGGFNNRVKENIGYPIIMWSLDTRDWEHRNSEQGTRIIIENIEDGSIVLMHDIYKSTIDTVRSVLPILKEQGYEFLTLDELFNEVELENGKTYYKK